MKYSEYAKDRFNKMLDGSPANACAARKSGRGMLFDAGVAELGGWIAGKLLIEGLIGGRGQVNFGDMELGMDRLPTLELFLDDPVLAVQTAYTEQDGVFGVREADGSYALGLKVCERADAAAPAGNIVLAGATSLTGAVFAASRAVPLAIEALLKGGAKPEQIQWAWGVCPIPVLCDDAAKMQQRTDRTLGEDSVVSVWVRGEDEFFQSILNSYVGGCVRLHNLKTAKTLQKENI